MNEHAWIEEFPGDVTVCDTQGIIVAMNAHATRSFASDGGRQLIGSNLLDCHPEPSRTKLAEMLRTQQGNIYTIDKDGARKLVYQSPWYRGGEFAGLVELGLPVPKSIPNFVRPSST